jgi:hypothetical protein
MANDVDALLQMWQEQRDQARQSEDQRAVMTNIVLVLASAGLGLLAQHGVRDHAMLFVTVSLTLLGGYGAITSLKYRERYELHITEARTMRRRLDAIYPQLHLEEDWHAARAAHRERFGVVYRVRLHYLWTALHVAIAMTGLGLTIVIAMQS